MRVVRAAAAAAAISLFSGPAMSAALFVQVSGAIATGSDAGDIFGLGGDLDGEAFSLSYVMMTNSSVPGSDAQDTWIDRGSSVGVKGGTYAILSIAGIDYTLQGQFQHWFSRIEQGASGIEQQLQLTDGPNAGLTIGAYGTPFIKLATMPPGGNLCLVANCAGSLDEAGLNIAFDIGSYTATYDPRFAMATPEPAAWGLMIMGFGLAGVGLRQRRRAIA